MTLLYSLLFMSQIVQLYNRAFIRSFVHYFIRSLALDLFTHYFVRRSCFSFCVWSLWTSSIISLPVFFHPQSDDICLVQIEWQPVALLLRLINRVMTLAQWRFRLVHAFYTRSFSTPSSGPLTSIFKCRHHPDRTSLTWIIQTNVTLLRRSVMDAPPLHSEVSMSPPVLCPSSNLFYTFDSWKQLQRCLYLCFNIRCANTQLPITYANNVLDM